MIYVDDETRGSVDKLAQSLTEDLDRLSALETFYNPWTDRAPGFDPNWQVIGSGNVDGAAVFSETDLEQIRRNAKHLAETNEYAINGHENRISYVIGTGHKYTAVSQGDAAESKIEAVQDAIDEFCKVNKWEQRQQEIMRRVDRDGECFLRFFEPENNEPGNVLQVRFVEPWQVYTPDDMRQNEAASYGILTDPDDIETRLAYFVDATPVVADDIQHRKGLVDFNTKRGIPLFYAVFDKLRRIEKIYEAIALVAQIQAKFALIRKHQSQTKANVQAMVTAKSEGTSTDVLTGKTSTIDQYPTGAIVDAPASTEYEFPTSGVDASRYVTLIQALLRGVASRLVMPEFMLTSDASNANFASTMVAEGPAVKNFERLQSLQREADVEVIERAVNVAGVDMDGVQIQVGLPNLITRDALQEANAAQIYHRMEILSPQTLSGKLDLDYAQEQENIAAHREALMGDMVAQMPDGLAQPPDSEADNGEAGIWRSDSDGEAPA